MSLELIKLLLQLLVLGIAGGGVSYYYNRLQKNREIVLSAIKDLSDVHTKFLALRYRYNTFFIPEGNLMSAHINADDVAIMKWKCYEEACMLIGAFQTLKPLILKFVPKLEAGVTDMEAAYQGYRRSIRANTPVYQSQNGKTEERLNKLKVSYNEVIATLTDKL